jgi:hypothetical protein
MRQTSQIKNLVFAVTIRRRPFRIQMQDIFIGKPLHFKNYSRQHAKMPKIVRKNKKTGIALHHPF